jgi:hypothetical protein
MPDRIAKILMNLRQHEYNSRDYELSPAPLRIAHPNAVHRHIHNAALSMASHSLKSKVYLTLACLGMLKEFIHHGTQEEGLTRTPLADYLGSVERERTVVYQCPVADASAGKKTVA